ncbi:predicted protein, partial [Nematostella vectensis]
VRRPEARSLFSMFGNKSYGGVSGCFGLEMYKGDADNAQDITDKLILQMSILVTITATMENSLLLLAILRSSELQHPSYILLGCLAFSDLMTGAVSQPVLVAAYLIAKYERMYHTSCYTLKAGLMTAIVFSGVSLLTLTAVAIERFLALYFHLRYNDLVTKQRVLLLFASFWPMVILTMVMPASMLKNLRVFAVIFGSILFICSSAMVFFYRKIYRIIRRHLTEIHAQEFAVQCGPHVIMSSILKARKTVALFLVVTSVFFIRWAPFVVVGVLYLYGLDEPFIVQLKKFSVIFVLAGSSANPIIYCWRLEKIRRTMRKELSKIFAVFRCNK